MPNVAEFDCAAEGASLNPKPYRLQAFLGLGCGCLEETRRTGLHEKVVTVSRVASRITRP